MNNVCDNENINEFMKVDGDMNLGVGMDE